MEYTELQVTSNFSFLRGASHPEEIMEYAAAIGYKQVAITDCNTLAGIVRAHSSAKKAGIRLIIRLPARSAGWTLAVGIPNRCSSLFAPLPVVEPG